MKYTQQIEEDLRVLLHRGELSIDHFETVIDWVKKKLMQSYRHGLASAKKKAEAKEK